ncbi:hypothetical protein GA0074694_5141 [Micromonospora inyonensis]|uniref:Lipoprotein n=1 Tax=Micromonospora inyonensis TaxID=47866 RepID=A0A1C6SGC7_9ACTN|nr:hypothetical protein GA0074694_5141 [Micromonospora inyonensis]
MRVLPLGRATLAVTLSAVLTAACGAGTPSPSRSPSSSASVAGGSPAASGSPPERCEAGVLSNPAKGGGSDLKVRILRQQGGGPGWDIALPAASVKSFPEFTGDAKASDTSDSFARAFDEGGAFSHDGAVIELSLYNRRSSRLTIHDIRVVNKRIVCPPEGLLFLEGNEGGGLVDLVYSLDAAAPVAHSRSASGEISTEPYFTNDVIQVEPTDQATVQMDMSGVRFAYEFDIAIDYSVGGESRSQLVRRRNGPFRVTTALCPRPDLRSRLSEGDVQRLKAQRYGLVRRRLPQVDASGGFVYENVTATEFVRSCPTW